MIGWRYGTGRRKRSVARVFLKAATCTAVIVNGMPLGLYFRTAAHAAHAVAPLHAAAVHAVVKANVQGGGVGGQAGAVRLGISRALACLYPGMRRTLASARLLTRDPREVERKKPGLRKARRRRQFSKR
ncbi:30S ribosomal protein S9 [Candidatus Tremblaya princeps]|jgi:small subunit ribosomal protein S9|uniref:30S ribosomal protein S9 n=1 Tax=Tremblaya princeps TaxID=189385 RepID=A0A143WP39_TREPR|nr:30S ribosomal protein S9 [Candidatus Tremblaya princeps]